LKEKTGFKLSDELEEQLFVLNKYYTVSRYPDAANGLPSESVDRIEAERGLKIAEEIFDYARGFIRNKEKS
ncbi:MAG: HEPN domain-containing protein, partial [Archaeoglobaceae archaeon]